MIRTLAGLVRSRLVLPGHAVRALGGMVRALGGRVGRGVGLSAPRTERVGRGLAAPALGRVRGFVRTALVRLIDPPEVTRTVAYTPSIEVVETAPTAARLAAWVAAVRGDAGCPAGPHAGCAAARRLGELRDATPAALAALEETATQTGRAACVRTAAVDALARLGTADARSALGRMESVTRRRLGWEGRTEDAALLARLREIIRTRGAADALVAAS